MEKIIQVIAYESMKNFFKKTRNIFFLPTIYFFVIGVVLLRTGLLSHSMHLIEHVNALYLVFFFLLMVLYEGIRAMQWYLQLRFLGVEISMKQQIVAFIASEIGKEIPGGLYIKNAMLYKRGKEYQYISSAASLFSLLMEIAVSFIVLFILGVGSWTTIVRLGIGVFFCLCLLTYLFVKKRPITNHQVHSRKVLHNIHTKIELIVTGMSQLATPKRLIAQGILCSSYLLCASAAFYVVTVAEHVHNLSFSNSISVYFFSLAITLLPISISNIGVFEISSIRAFSILGVAPALAIQTVLANRLLTMLPPLMLVIVAIAIMYRDINKVKGNVLLHMFRKRE